MPFKSKAQRRKFAEMMVKGEISPEVFEEWNRETGSATLPERVARKPAKKRSKASRTRKKTTAARPAKRARKRKSPGKAARKRKAS